MILANLIGQTLNRHMRPGIADEWTSSTVTPYESFGSELHPQNIINGKINQSKVYVLGSSRLSPILIMLCCILIAVSGCTNKTKSVPQNPALTSTPAQTAAPDGMSTAQTAAANAPASAQMALTQTAQEMLRILYIYKTDLATAQDYESYIESNGITVDLFTESNAATANLAQYNLIMIGPDTGNFSAWQTEPWGDPAGADAGYIDSTGIPILGLWRGGGLFFKVRNQYINVGNCWSGSTTDVLVLDQNFTIWNEPSKVAVGSGVIDLYNNPTEFEAVYYPSPLENILPIGRQSTDAEHYSIMMQGNKYFFWGYRGGPSLMTTKGKKAIMNIIHYLVP